MKATRIAVGWALLAAGLAGAASAADPGGVAARADSSFTLRGGQEGTVFRSLTVEGEDRIRFEIERPGLRFDLDPAKAPGLDWGSALDVLDRTAPDLAAPMLVASAREPSPYVARPWLSHFASGAVAVFRPEVRGVERWKLTIVDARGEVVAAYQGRGEPPREIAWDGRSQAGAPVVPGLTYSYVLEAHDKAGNRRNFVGQGFRVSAYRLETPDGPALTFSGLELPAPDPRRPSAEAGTPTILVEAAIWLNQGPHPNRPVRVIASARSREEAQALGATVAHAIAPRLLGGPARLLVSPEVRADAPEGGTVLITSRR